MQVQAWLRNRPPSLFVVLLEEIRYSHKHADRKLNLSLSTPFGDRSIPPPFPLHVAYVWMACIFLRRPTPLELISGMCKSYKSVVGRPTPVIQKRSRERETRWRAISFITFVLFAFVGKQAVDSGGEAVLERAGGPRECTTAAAWYV